MPSNSDKKLSNIFVGREAEFNKLSELLSKARNGEGGFVVLNGEESIGKTSLVQYFIESQNQAEIIYVAESFKDVKAHEPYAPFIKIIERINGTESSSSRDKNTVEKEVDFKEDTFSTESLYSLQAKHDLVKQQLLSKVLTFSKNKALILLLNDAHLAPLTSWKFIHYLSESIHQSNILLIITIRQYGHEQKQERVPVYANVLQRMNREGIVTKIRLDRFDIEDLGNYLQIAFPRKDFSSKFLDLLFEVSGGIPGRIRLLLERLLNNETIFQYNGIWVDKDKITKDDFLRLISTGQNSKKVQQKFDSLADSQKELLILMSLLDEPFHHRFVLAISELNRIKVLKELLAFHELKILHQVNEECYKFDSSILKNFISSSLTDADKAEKHLFIAKRIDSNESIEYYDKVFCLAYHYYLGGSKINAFKYLRAASEMAIENFAFQEALDLINKALDATNQFSADKDNGEIAQLMIWASWLERILGNFDNSIKHCEAALGFLQDEKYRLIKNQALIQLGFTYFRLNKWNKALWCFNECLRRNKSLGQLDQAMAIYGLGNVYFELAEYEKSHKYFESALEIAQEMQATQLIANVFNTLGALENIRNHKMRAIALYSKSIPIFKSLGDDFGLARVYHNIGMTHADDRNWQQANEFYGQSLTVSDTMGLVPLKSITFLNRANAFANLNNLAEAREYNTKAHRLLVSLKDELGIAEYHKIQGIIEFKNENWDTAQEHFEQALEKFDAVKNKLGLAETAFEYATMELAQKKNAAAMERFEVALSNYRELNLNDKVLSIENQIKEMKSTSQQSLKSTGRTGAVDES